MTPARSWLDEFPASVMTPDLRARFAAVEEQLAEVGFFGEDDRVIELLDKLNDLLTEVHYRLVLRN